MKNYIFILMATIMVAMTGFYGCKPEITDPVGNGTAMNPFKVATVADLKRVASGEQGPGGTWAKDKHYKQVADINLSSVSNWTPLSSNSFFSGTYDGGGYTISNLTINKSGISVYDDTGSGLFLNVSGTVANVRLLNVNITAATGMGSVASNVRNGGTIHHCSVHNLALSASSDLAGGVAGTISLGGTVSNCMTIGGTIGNNNSTLGTVGGIAGTNSGMIKNCYSTVNIKGNGIWYGGLVGYTSGMVQYCYATGDVTSQSSIGHPNGGIAGNTFGANTSKIYNCVALNREVKRTSAPSINTLGRITGSITGSGSNIADMSTNYARSDMKLSNNTTTFTIPASEISLTSIHGANVVAADYNGNNSDTWWKGTAKFPSSEWDFAKNRLPHLKGFDGLVQTPVVN